MRLLPLLRRLPQDVVGDTFGRRRADNVPHLQEALRRRYRAASGLGIAPPARGLGRLAHGLDGAAPRGHGGGRAPGPRDRAFARQRPREPASGAARRSARGRRLHALLRSHFTLLCRYFPPPRSRVNASTSPFLASPPLCAFKNRNPQYFYLLCLELGRLAAEPPRGPLDRSTHGRPPYAVGPEC